jgi:hypothetical protein
VGIGQHHGTNHEVSRYWSHPPPPRGADHPTYDATFELGISEPQNFDVGLIATN